MCKFLVEECGESVDAKLVNSGLEIGLKIPDLSSKQKIYPSMEEKEKYLLFALNEYWKYLAHKSAQVVERSDKNSCECMYILLI
jgi:hypothetical protein